MHIFEYLTIGVAFANLLVVPSVVGVFRAFHHHSERMDGIVIRVEALENWRAAETGDPNVRAFSSGHS
jgi:hypothetical protein